jgi:hypothetical protein
VRAIEQKLQMPEGKHIPEANIKNLAAEASKVQKLGSKNRNGLDEQVAAHVAALKPVVAKLAELEWLAQSNYLNNQSLSL